MANENVSANARTPAHVRGDWRRWVVGAGLALIFGSVALRTGTGAFVALWNVILLMGALLIVTLPVRTVTAVELLAPFCLGTSTVGLAILAGSMFDHVLGSRETATRALGIPVVEETLKLAPVLWILWAQRRGRSLTFGASDVLLLGAASGAGFYWIEEAFIIHNHHSWSFVGRFPTTDIAGNFTAGHALWTAIAALTIGVALLLRGSRLRMLLVGVSGWFWSVLDHAANNYGVNYRDSLAGMLRFVTAHGHVSLGIFVSGLCLALALDTYWAYFAATASKIKLPPFPRSWESSGAAARYLRLRLRFAYTGARYRLANAALRKRLVTRGISTLAALSNAYPRAAA